jgi:flagella basal body P-ring formation protein FlgA
MWTAFLLLLPSSCVTVAGDRILAADLAPSVRAFESLDPQTVVGFAPLPGLERRLSRSELVRVLGQGTAAQDLPPSICVTRSSRPVDPEWIRRAMRAVLPEDAELELLQWPESPLPAGRPDFALAGLRAAAEPGRYNWRGKWISDSGARSMPLAATARIRLRRPVLVATRALEAGAVVTPDDFALDWREVVLPPPPAPAEPSSLAGYKVRRPLQAGQTVEPGSLVPPQAARAGETVTLVCESGAARIALEAQVLTAGRLGDVILVKSPLNGKRLRARLEAPGRAVALRSPR